MTYDDIQKNIGLTVILKRKNQFSNNKLECYIPTNKENPYLFTIKGFHKGGTHVEI
jgi:hypothetical protein